MNYLGFLEMFEVVLIILITFCMVWALTGRAISSIESPRPYYLLFNNSLNVLILLTFLLLFLSHFQWVQSRIDHNLFSGKYISQIIFSVIIYLLILGHVFSNKLVTYANENLNERIQKRILLKFFLFVFLIVFFIFDKNIDLNHLLICKLALILTVIFYLKDILPEDKTTQKLILWMIIEIGTDLAIFYNLEFINHNILITAQISLRLFFSFKILTICNTIMLIRLKTTNVINSND